MSAAVALGGFTGPEADTLGYAIRKKKSSVLRAQKEKFVTQAAERGVEPKVIDAVFKAFEPFERYGFNKAHATCYGLIAYQTAYLKANYTVEYMTSVLTAFRDNAEKVAAAVVECRRLGIEVRPPDVHRSGLGFTVEGDSIRFGLLAVKNVGEGAIESIIAARESGGEFRSLTDFCSRVDVRLANRKVLESLAKVGALNVVGPPGAGPARARRRAGRRPGHAARPDHRPDVAVRRRRRRRHRARAPAPGDARDARPRAAALGEGAARAVPVRPPDGRGRRARRPVRDGLLGRPEGRVARRAAGRPGRDRDRDPVGDHEDEVDDGGRHARGPPGDARGRGVPADLRADDRDVARRRDPAGRRPGRPPGRGGVAARRCRVGLGHRLGARTGGVRARGRGARPAGRWTARRAAVELAMGTETAAHVPSRSRWGRGGEAACPRARWSPTCRGSRLGAPPTSRTSRASPRASRSRPTRSRRTSPPRRWPRAWRSPTSRRSPTSSATSPRRPPRRPASR